MLFHKNYARTACEQRDLVRASRSQLAVVARFKRPVHRLQIHSPFCAEFGDSRFLFAVSLRPRVFKNVVGPPPGPRFGPAAARNHAYRLSRGDYIQFIDADHLLSPDKITQQIKVLRESPD